MQRTLAAFAALCLAATSAHAQGRVGSDSANRWTHYGRSIVYGTALGFGYAGIEQWRKEPPEWGDGWDGYKERAASNIGEFVIQETVTEGLAAARHRPIAY